MIRLALLLALLPAFAHAATLHVSGNKLIYRGDEVRLQGVAVGDPLLAREGRTAEDYAFLAKDWNANAVRISVHPGVWREYGRRAVKEALAREISAALEAGLFVILDWHAIGWPDGYMQPAPEGMLPDLYDTDFALAEDFWRHMAAAFGHEGRVAFELWNEPASGALAEGEPRWVELQPHWQRLATLLREAGARNLILAAGNDWGYLLKGARGLPLEDGNAAYAWHAYAGVSESHHLKWLDALDGLHMRVPVVVTEWGFTRKREAESFGIPFRELLRAQGLHHTAWCWHPEWTPHMLEADWRTPTHFGAFVKETLWMASVVIPAKRSASGGLPHPP